MNSELISKRIELAAEHRDRTTAAIRRQPIEVSAESTIAGFLKPVTTLLSLGNDNKHFSMNLGFLLVRGFTGIAGDARRSAKRVANEEAHYLGCISDCYEAATECVARHAEMADLVARSSGGQSLERLKQIGDVCRSLAVGPPESFREAVQLFWFAWNIRGRGTVGRLDQHLYPFYERDLASGCLTRDDAFVLLVDLWNGFNISGCGDTLINLMVGGQDGNGHDATNALSLMMIETALAVGKPEPHLSARLHARTPESFRRKLTELQAMGHGQGTIYNDEVIVPSLVEKGVPAASARNYANDGCTEVIIDGESDIAFVQLEAVKSLELTLFNGEEAPIPGAAIGRYHARTDEERLVSTGLTTGYKTGDFAQMTSFDQLHDAFLRQYLHQLDLQVDGLCEHERRVSEEGVSSPFMAGTFPETLRLGVDPARGGFTVPCRMVFSGSIPTAADGLAGIKKVVFEDKMCTPAEMIEALRVNFEGHEDLRRRCLAAPKFGNDDDRVDQIAADIARRFCQKIARYPTPSGKPLWPALYNFLFNDHAKFLGATPDGRKWRDPIGEHYSPTPGHARSGPTALIRSAAKGPLADACGSSIFHVSLSRDVVSRDGHGLNLMRGLVEGALEQGAAVMNIAVYDIDRMRDAQAHPEKHKDLVVRVWGFSARFVDLSSDMQAHIIQRTLGISA
jgi:pyruvate-formate lyase